MVFCFALWRLVFSKIRCLGPTVYTHAVKVMLVVLCAAIRGKEKGVPCMGCFMCFWVVFGLRAKT